MKRPSEINKTFIIKEEEWVISLARIANTSFTQHAFIIIEAIEDKKPSIYFIDFIGPHWLKSIPKNEIGEIRFHRYGEENKAPEGLIFSCKRRMMKLNPGDYIGSKQWYISKDKALELIQLVQQEKEQNIKIPFNILGNESSLAKSSAKVSNKKLGHSCFTWAKEKLHAINDPSIQIKSNTIGDFINIDEIASITALTAKNVHQIGIGSNLSNLGIFAFCVITPVAMALSDKNIKSLPCNIL
jgi:hypothetical protein